MSRCTGTNCRHLVGFNTLQSHVFCPLITCAGPEFVDNIMMSPSYWNLPKPGLIISVTGSAEEFKEDAQLSAHDQPYVLFKVSLPKAVPPSHVFVPVGRPTKTLKCISLSELLYRIADYVSQSRADFSDWGGALVEEAKALNLKGGSFKLVKFVIILVVTPVRQVVDPEDSKNVIFEEMKEMTSISLVNSQESFQKVMEGLANNSHVEFLWDRSVQGSMELDFCNHVETFLRKPSSYQPVNMQDLPNPYEKLKIDVRTTKVILEEDSSRFVFQGDDVFLDPTQTRKRMEHGIAATGPIVNGDPKKVIGDSAIKAMELYFCDRVEEFLNKQPPGDTIKMQDLPNPYEKLNYDVRTTKVILEQDASQRFVFQGEGVILGPTQTRKRMEHELIGISDPAIKAMELDFCNSVEELLKQQPSGQSIKMKDLAVSVPNPYEKLKHDVRTTKVILEQDASQRFAFQGEDIILIRTQIRKRMELLQENYKISKDGQQSQPSTPNSNKSWSLKNTLTAWTKTFVDVNHSHLCLVGDEYSDFGSEVPFRSEIERYVSEKFGSPMLQFVFGGGQNTVATTLGFQGAPNAFSCIVKGSGRFCHAIEQCLELKSKDSKLDDKKEYLGWLLQTARFKPDNNPDKSISNHDFGQIESIISNQAK